ncbi:hypothetical protein [Candidatus Methanomethylophilus sp. 1R26]|uniref:restriction endonuclease subunit S n=1 Tax=Candidatus Methanomethylophilus sp. 1R26 TaxID=1769296 RepID=UPI000AC39C8E|nr:hypothetical protein [Candidatus Methanomethylophilus sp. 1R26]
MLPDKAGITQAESIPLTGTVSKYQPKDVLLSNIRPYFKKIWQSTRNGTCSNDVLVIRAKDERISDYLFALLSEDRFFDHVMLGSKGTKMPRGDKEQILTYTVCDLPFSEMLAIGGWFSLINQKISCNQAINDNLMKSARAAFSEMMDTSELSSGVLSDVVSITMGQSPPGESLSEDDAGTLFYQGRAEFGPVFPTPRLYTSDPRRMAKQGSILMSVRAPVGDINVALERCCIGRGLAAIESNNGMQGFVHYLMDYLKPKLDVFNGDGTVFGSINKESVNGLEISLPEQKSIEQFNKYAEKVDAEIRSNHLEMLKLSEIRDYLLPKLMSGEIDVSTLKMPTKYSFNSANK